MVEQPDSKPSEVMVFMADNFSQMVKNVSVNEGLFFMLIH
jgi:hypothetical protein